MWAAACTLYELSFGDVMLDGSRGDYIIYRTYQLAGPPPPEWAPYWDLEKFCTAKGKSSVLDSDADWAKRLKHRLEDKTKGEDAARIKDTEQLIALLRMMLKMDPDERPEIKDVLGHPWFGQARSNAGVSMQDCVENIDEVTENDGVEQPRPLTRRTTKGVA